MKKTSVPTVPPPAPVIEPTNWHVARFAIPGWILAALVEALYRYWH